MPPALARAPGSPGRGGGIGTADGGGGAEDGGDDRLRRGREREGLRGQGGLGAAG